MDHRYTPFSVSASFAGFITHRLISCAMLNHGASQARARRQDKVEAAALLNVNAHSEGEKTQYCHHAAVESFHVYAVEGHTHDAKSVA